MTPGVPQMTRGAPDHRISEGLSQRPPLARANRVMRRLGL